MQILQILYYFNFSFFYLKSNAIFGLANEVSSCLVPYAREKCDGSQQNGYNCWIHPMYRSRYFKCNNHDILLRSNNLLLLYPPFIEILLNRSKIIDQLRFYIRLDTSQDFYDIDLRPLNYIQFPVNLTLITFVTSRPAEILFRTHTWFKRIFYPTSKESSYAGIFSKWQITHNNSSMKNNDVICYHFTIKEINDTDDTYYDLSYTCPSDQCLTDKNQTRICLGSTPCRNMGDMTLLCRIDQLRSNDQFHSKLSFLYKNLIITTSDNRKQTLHQFSTYLLNRCIAERLVIIVIYGRLDIPSWNSTALHYPNGLTMEVEFWHGNCSTFEILYNNDLQRMYETNLITLGNFYTGQIDRLNITCAMHQSMTTGTKKPHLSNLIIACLLSIMISLMCIVGCYYGRSSVC